MAGKTPFTHPDPPMRMPDPPEITGPGEVEMTEDEVKEQLRKTKLPTTDNRGMSPALGGSVKNRP